MKSKLPFGSWVSPLTAEMLSRSASRLGQPRLADGAVYWVEGRPDEGGRQHVRRARKVGGDEPVTPAGVNVRSRVHEYGGGDYGFVGSELVMVDAATPGIRRANGDPIRGTLSNARYADLVGSPDGNFLVAVEEEPREEAEPENRLVAIDLRSGQRTVLCEGRDFVAQPAFAPDGSALVWIAWDHPNMPWDGTDLLRVAWGGEGPNGSVRHLAGGEDESIFQPGFGLDGTLYFISDRSGWWNLQRWTGEQAVSVCSQSAEFGRPLWVFGLSTWAPETAGRLLCLVGEGGQDRLVRVDVENGTTEELPLPFTELEGLRVEGRFATFLGASASQGACVVRLDLDGGDPEILARSHGAEVEAMADLWSPPETLEYATVDGRTAHAFLYRPQHPEFEGKQGSRPPLLVKSHGGPTAATSPALRLPIQYWTSRGFSVVDVNYAGSTGYGRDYRNLLRGLWGIADVDDCEAAAAYAAKVGAADEAKLAITGGSAGGYTTLCALTFRDRFSAGASHYGIGDLETLARDTHKFESRYLDRLVGPYPEAQEVYQARSPIHFTEQLSCPVIFLQGLDDPIVPPNQAEAMADALAIQGILHAHVTFAGEGHGFRSAPNIQRALESEWAFYGKVFGFETPGAPELKMTGSPVSQSR